MADRDDKPFEVKDRRRFTTEGEAVDGAEAAAEAKPEAAGTPAHPGVELPPVDFSTLVLSLASSVVYHLGEIIHPEKGKAERDLPMAKQTIDLLALLQEKTRGNLTDEEASLLDSVLYELRVKYVQAVR
jgi:uncharacterized protein DUF1844